MSSHQDKVTAAYDFLANRASTRKLTNHREVGIVIGQTLMERSQRRISDPVRREKVIRVLQDVDRRSFAEKGVLLSAIVTHFWDAVPGKRFWDAARTYGLDVSQTDIAVYQQQVFDAFPDFVGQEGLPKTVASSDDDESVGALDGELRELEQALKDVNERFASYVGRHRAGS